MRPEKASIVEDLTGRLNASPFIFVADYSGLRVAQFAELRNRLYSVGARCYVVKNTFLRRALSEAGLPEMGALTGQNAIVTGEKDVAAAAKILKNFTAEFKKPAVRAGIVDKLAVTTEQIQMIADLPSREVLLSQLLALLNTPATMLVRILNEPASALARVLKAKADRDGGGEVTEAAPEPAAEAPAPEATAVAPAEAAPATEATAPTAEAPAETPAS